MVAERTPIMPEPAGDDFEGDLVQAGMEPAQTRAFRRALDRVIDRMMVVVATKVELQTGLDNLRDELRGEMHQMRDDLRREMREMRDDLRREMRETRDDLRREMEIRFAEVNARFDRMERRMYWGGGLLFGALITLLVRSFV